MAYNKQMVDNKTCKLQEECRYLKSLIHRYREAISFNSQKPPRVGHISRGNLSIYKKVNVNAKSKQALNSEKKLQCNATDTSKLLPVTCASQKSQTDDVLSSASRSGRMYLNPHFSKLNGVETQNSTKNSNFSELKRSVHLNPKMSELKPSVHVNPKVLAEIMKLRTQNECALLDRHTETSDIMPGNTSSSTKQYIVRSKTKLVNVNTPPKILISTSQFVPKKKLSPLQKMYQGPLMSMSRTKLVRAKPRRSSLSLQSARTNSKNCAVVKAAKAVCTKYKFTRSSTTRTPVTKALYSSAVNRTVNQESKYKIDRRFHKIPKRLKKVKKYSLQYETLKREPKVHNKPSKMFSKSKKICSFSRTKFGNRTWSNSLQPRRVTVLNKKLMRIGSTPNQRERNSSSRQSSCLVRIGGVLYKTSKMKLTRSLASKEKTEPIARTARQNMKKSSFVVYVRGNKFLMDRTGKTLVRASQREVRSSVNKSCGRSLSLKRIDIGGVTFIQKSTNVLIRTNTHNARNLLSQAKQKSIAMLTRKLKKNNQPCLFYQRFGKCGRLEKGTCPRVHDRKHVAVCRKFLQGSCEITGCTLSHDVGPEKMPTCKYFLDGCCVRENCPYLHVKVSAKAGICKNFLSGYCADGGKCRKRHTYICPDFEKTGNCPKGKYCPYPHKTIVKKKRNRKHSTERGKEQTSASRGKKRYYETGKVMTETEQMSEQTSAVLSDFDAKRLKLLKRVEDMKRSYLNAEQLAGIQVDPYQNLMPAKCDEPEVKRPKIGVLPAYIPLGS